VEELERKINELKSSNKDTNDQLKNKLYQITDLEADVEKGNSFAEKLEKTIAEKSNLIIELEEDNRSNKHEIEN
jgi:hypothetical protein